MEKLVKKYSLIRIDPLRVNNTLKIELTYGDVEGYSDSLSIPKEFDTEEDALNFLLENSQTMWGNWIIVPMYSIDYFYY